MDTPPKKKPIIRPTEMPTTDETRFWMVSVDGFRGPRKRFSNATIAYAEAIRLAQERPGVAVSLMEAIDKLIAEFSKPQEEQPG